MIFHVSGLPKSIQNRCKNALEKNIGKIPAKNCFRIPFWLPKTSQNPRTFEKNEKNHVQKKSSKKTALQITAKQKKASLLGPRRILQPPFQ